MKLDAVRHVPEGKVPRRFRHSAASTSVRPVTSACVSTTTRPLGSNIMEVL
jgi:hypothetical protein